MLFWHTQFTMGLIHMHFEGNGVLQHPPTSRSFLMRPDMGLAEMTAKIFLLNIFLSDYTVGSIAR